MKRLLFVLMLWPAALFGLPAHAQVLGDVYSVATPQQFQSYGTSASVGITEAVLNRIIRATCTSACFIQINISGKSLGATKATGVYLPAGLPALFSVSPGSKVQVIGDTAAGQLFIQELSR